MSFLLDTNGLSKPRRGDTVGRQIGRLLPEIARFKATGGPEIRLGRGGGAGVEAGRKGGC